MTQWSYIRNWMHIVIVCKAVTAPLFMIPTALTSMPSFLPPVWSLIFSNPCQAKQKITTEIQQKASNAVLRVMLGDERTPDPMITSSQNYQDAEVWLHRKGTHIPRTLKLQNHSCKNNQRTQQYDKYKKWILMRKWSKQERSPNLH